ncbi:MAG: rhomboid family intramembrane serine protease [Bryobacteraceae bacterium]
MDKRRMCPHCRAFITTDDKVCPYCNNTVGPRAIERRSPSDIAGLIPASRYVTSLILLINVGLYAATIARTGGYEPDGSSLIAFGAKYTPAILAGEWWRFITAGFLHGGVLHILMNSWVLFDLGAQVEELFGQARMIVIYLVATIGGFYASYLWSISLSVGASAGIFGLLGAMIALGMRSPGSFGAELRGYYVRWAVYGFAMGLLPGLRIDNAAHLGGLASGFLVAYIAGTPKLVDRGMETAWKVLAGLSVAVTIFAFLKMALQLNRG